MNLHKNGKEGAWCGLIVHDKDQQQEVASGGMGHWVA